MKTKAIKLHFKRPSKLFSAKIVLFVFVILFFTFLSWASKPASGTTKVGTPTLDKTSSASLSFKTVSYGYYSTSLPKGWHIDESKGTDSPYDLDLLAYTSGDSDGQVSIVTAPLPEGGLPAVANYNLRVTQTSQYALFKSSLLPKNTITFDSINTNPINYTLFMTNPKYYASISVSGDMTSQVLRILSQSSQNWLWKQ